MWIWNYFWKKLDFLLENKNICFTFATGNDKRVIFVWKIFDDLSNERISHRIIAIMKFLTNIVESISKVAVKVALAVVVLFAESFFIRAQESPLRIYYRFDNATVDAAYLSNA